VSGRLGYDPFVAEAPGQVSVSITARGSRYTARVQLTGRGEGHDGERRVQAAVRGCDELIDALALAVSLALDPEAVERPKRPRRSRELAWAHRPRWGLASPAPRPPATVITTAQRPVADNVDWRMTARLGLSLGSAPSPTPDLRLALRFVPGDFGLGVEIRAEVPIPRAISSGTISAHFAGVTASGCFGWSWLRGCALLTAGGLVLHGQGFASARTRAVLFGSAGGRVAVSWPAEGSLSLEAVVDLEVPMVRTGVRLGDSVVWRAEPVMGSASVGLGWRL